MRAEELAAADRVLFVHAHPDDETLSTGGLIARLAPIRGVFVLTATRGECGEIADPALGDLPDLAAHREQELATALAHLAGAGTIHHAFLGTPPARAAGHAPRRYTDSGMEWGPGELAVPGADTGPDALTRADLSAELADVLAYCERIQPTLIVSYGPLGGYGHPDHLRVRDLARSAAEQMDIPYLAVVSGLERERLSQAQRDRLVSFDGSRYAAQVRAALQAHASQMTVLAPDAAEIVVRHSGGQIEEIGAVEYFLPS